MPRTAAPKVIARPLARGWTSSSRWLGFVGAELAVAAPVSIVFFALHQPTAVLRYLVGLTAGLVVQHLFVWAIRRRVGPERSSPADLLTLSRATVGAILAGLVAAGFQERSSGAGWLVWITILLAVTVTDWLDGPLARRHGPTLLGRALDIEADSWLTLWCGAAAVAWGGLAAWCLLPPLAHYIYPVRALLTGGLPSGGGPWWGRVTGTLQMALFLGALLPVEPPFRAAVLGLLALPISGSQLLALLAPLVTHRSGG
ncbi:MAG TPA: CDP-alcohol phosphatidyltransferase family protein [Ktedonobacterales bacterium]|nr:CDP-alcohol phosphatidyltransferase family protein [Ktedonobacterales bacterium]